MKIALIAPANRWKCPFINIYTRILDEIQVPYDIISWNRARDENYGDYQYNGSATGSLGHIGMFIPYLKYACFVKKLIRKNAYDRLIVFTPQAGIFLYPFLRRYYAKKFIMDYRDLSIEQKLGFKQIYKSLLNYSFANTISSPGFKKYLPPREDYILSHNLNIDIVNEALEKPIKVSLEMPLQMDVLTIGGIRDFESNSEVIRALGNDPLFKLRFIGKGDASALLEKLCESAKYENVTFEGYYQKEEEPSLVIPATFINIFYPRKPSHDTAISNRFYNSLIFRKPMIVTANTTQGDYAEKYGVGVAINDCSNLHDQLINYLQSNNYVAFEENADLLLTQFVDDYYRFKNMVITFANN